MRGWSAIALAVLVAGTVVAVFVSGSLASNAAARSHLSFKTSSVGITSSLQLAIQHEEDLVVSAGGFVAGNPGASEAEFSHWVESVQALKRYPELLGIGHSTIVPASQLRAFAARAVADPAGTLAANGSFQVVPAGARPFYCLATGFVFRSRQTELPAGFDYCAGASGKVSLAARDSGKDAYVPLQEGKSAYLSVVSPVYRDGVPPATTAARRAAFLGWVGMSVEPHVVLDQALTGHQGIAVSMRYREGSSDVAFESGRVLPGATSSAVSLGNGWTITTYGLVSASSVLADGPALAVLLAGIAVSVLLAALILVLATGRVRALRLVEEKTDELRHQALHDALTGLPNRVLIADRIDQLLARNRRNASVGAALYVDLDGFKNVNDTLGHEVGDRLLRAVAARLTASLRGVDTIGRMGGDEFVVLIDGGSIHSGPGLVAERILEVMRQPFEIAGAAMPMVVTASIGVAAGDREAPGELLRDADVALYQAKAAGKNCYETFQIAMEETIQRRYELELELSGALEGSQFRLAYQPIYGLDDLTLVGVEALIRWEHPLLGEIQPEEFVPLLESSGQIVEVGRWVLGEACAQVAAWRDRGSDLMLSVNVSGRQLDRDVVVDHVREALEASGLDPASLTVEVTETALVRNVETTARRLRELKALGIQLAIDDFGTGYSSLAYLRRFPVDCLKIDRTFTAAITGSPESDALLHTLVQLGKDLGLTVLAEGIETTGQLDHLRGEHVDEAQGFLLARPLDPATFEDRLLGPAGVTSAGRRGSGSPPEGGAMPS